ncbi:MAG: Ig-like domain-containing protein [Dysgonomonas sp.]|nr:Ig-like domain-containing protein [Dysgonomonas sp.]
MIKRLLGREKRHILQVLLIVVISAIVISCASIASPSGGDYDFDPPVVLKSTPAPNALNVKGRKIEIVFDELVQIEKPMEKVIVTPPQKNFPVIRAQNNKVIVELKDSLKEKTTYTIDFTDAIVDNNEKNPLENFALSFSTGDVIDSLAISGKVLTANNLEPVSGMYVGIHSDMSDTAFTKTPFLRISRTNELGKFSIKGVAPGEYKLYALDDVNRDYKYDNPSEAIAFLDSIVIPSSVEAVRYDSIFNINTFEFDSLKEVAYTRFLPDDIVLRSFTSSFKRQYLQKSERLTDDVLTVYFGAPTELPQIEVLDVPFDISEWSVLERTAGNDTLKYWITKPAMVAMDTITLKVSYNMTDSLNQLQPKTDTINFVNRNKKKDKDIKQENEEKEKKRKKKKNKKEEEEKIEFLPITTNIKSAFDIYDDVKIEFGYPVSDFEKNKLHLQHIKDSIVTDIDYQLIKDTLNPRVYRIKYKWEHNHNYQLSVDSAAFHSYNGLWNDKLSSKFTIKAQDKYGSLYLNIYGLPEGMPAFVELLNKSDSPVYSAEVKDGFATFLYLNPDTYYARVTLDANGNGKWDPGEYSENRQPEMVYYYDKTFEIKEYWEIEEDWSPTSVPLDKQKSLDITKNKPKDDNKRRKEMERRDAKSQRNSNSQQNSNNRYNNNSNSNNNNYNNTYRGTY